MLRNYRKPLVIAAPKVGLKHPKADSNINDFAPGNVFKPTIAKQYGTGSAAKVIICSGKVAFDIEAKLEEAHLKEATKVVRVEEIAPFPIAEIREHLKGARQVTWVQEESLNQGAF
jgi:probable 2-oxoglutarate dehydrogenase E1 component DHKTD1